MAQTFARGFDVTQVQYQDYIKQGILSWYDLDSSLREIHDREMEQWRKGRMLVSKNSFGDKGSLQRYINETYTCENQSLMIADRILGSLNMAKVTLTCRRKKWIIRRYKVPYWQNKRLLKMEEYK